MGLEELHPVQEPMPLTKTFVQQTIDEMTGLMEHAPVDTGVEQTSPVQRRCIDCRLALKRARSRDAVAAPERLKRDQAGITRSVDRTASPEVTDPTMVGP